MDLDELHAIGEKARTTHKRVRLRCCTAASCLSSGSGAVKDALDAAVNKLGIGDHVEVTSVGCLRLCCEGPLVQSEPSGALHGKVSPAQAEAIVQAAESKATLPGAVDTSQPFFTGQMPIVLENSGRIDPDSIESYVEAGGYEALWTALREMSPADVVAAISQSGLRGRGGAGYPTGLKWSMVAKHGSPTKYVICNADEGDPGAFMDRSVLESDPQRVLEGMAIAGYAVGASEGYVYVRGEYPLAIRRLEGAIKQAKRAGLLGTQIMSSSFDFKLEIRIGAGAFVCGEETALLASIEGRRGTPTARPPYPSERGLFGAPTVINNVETFANVPAILRKGAAWFAGIGTERSKGTKVFALAGKIKNTGLVEVPMGTPLRTIVEDMGGGSPDGARIKAVQTGGPSGGCIPAHALDTPVDYDSLAALGSIMGSGGMIVMDELTDMVDIARYFMEFSKDESCGKCIPCRAGTVQLLQLLSRIVQGEARGADLERLEQLCDMVKHASLCGLGQAAPNPVLSTLRYFRDDYTSKLRA
jgi:bidirectional [NiFe] hydrogenase diaphorase subunit